jgi:hypothetical protein
MPQCAHRVVPLVIDEDEQDIAWLGRSGGQPSARKGDETQ